MSSVKPDFKSIIRKIPDFPKKGILFYDITTLLKNPQAFSAVMDEFVSRYKDSGIQKIVGIDARGFIFGAPLALQLGLGFVPIRKSGKLPADVYESTYSLEYGNSTIAIHQDAISPGERVLLVDDLLATGGTMASAVELIKKLGGTIHGLAFLVELTDLNGRNKLNGCDIMSIVQY